MDARKYCGSDGKNYVGGCSRSRALCLNPNLKFTDGPCSSKNQPAPGSTSGCILLESDGGLPASNKTCCMQPNCKKFQCKSGITPNQSDMNCDENRKLKCETVGDVTYCICAAIYPMNGKCPDGYEIKTGPGGACDGRLPPSCICTGQSIQRQVCLKTPTNAPKKV
jgi:hypothetical protein